MKSSHAANMGINKESLWAASVFTIPTCFIEAAKKISAEAKISGEKGLMRKECTAYVVKISGAWKALWIGFF